LHTRNEEKHIGFPSQAMIEEGSSIQLIGPFDLCDRLLSQHGFLKREEGRLPITLEDRTTYGCNRSQWFRIL